MTVSTGWAAVSNRLWYVGALGHHRRFRRALAEPARVQRDLLRRILTANAETDFGRAHGFRKMLRRPDPWPAFRERVPPTAWDDLAPRIERIRRGEANVLTAEPVELLVPSSGSTAARKLIPYTATLREQFRRALGAWIVDAFDTYPEARDGPAYWSISPALPTDSSSGAVPVGFDEDSAYLGPLSRRLAEAAQAMPGAVSRIRDVETFRYVTLLRLVATEDLALVSVWHPSFWTLMLDAIPVFRSRLARDLRRGTLTPPNPLPSELHEGLARSLKPSPERAARLETVMRRSRFDARELWPRLALLSAWGDGPAEGAFRRLADRHPGVALQPKGLFATEAFVTLPFRGARPLAVTSHVFELVDEAGTAHAVSPQLRPGTYSVWVTTGGGLYRYRLGDRVHLEGFVEATPSLRFVGKEDRISDRRGEKLSEGFVMRVLRDLGLEGSRFTLLAPERDSEDRIAYVLYLCSGDGDPGPHLAEALDRRLSDNPHYRWARKLGQLGAARVASVGVEAESIYLRWEHRRGRRLGDVKPAVLSNESGWGRRFGPTS